MVESSEKIARELEELKRLEQQIQEKALKDNENKAEPEDYEFAINPAPA